MNVLTIMVDELSWWALGHTGGIAHTPNIDRLAARGLRFSQAYTPSPICVPTRAAIATGRYVHETGCWSSAEPYNGQQRGWAHAVRDAGYEAVSIGKLHYRSQADDFGFSTCLEPLHVVNGEGWVQGLLRKPVAPYDNAQSLAADIGIGDNDYHAFDVRVADQACAWLLDPARHDTPWSAFVSLLAPHFPLECPAAFYDLYDPTAFESEAAALPPHPILQEIGEYFDHDPYFTLQTRGIARAAYYGLCSFVDAQVGRVLDALNQAELRDKTLVIFTSDHGEMLGEKGFWTKSVMYDSAARVPLILSGPGIDPGDWSAPVSLIDLAPTICAAMDIEADFTGVSLLDPQPNRAVISEYHDGGCSVGFTMLRWDHWKLVYYAEGHPAQLFDLVKDPEETTDLSLLEPDILQAGLSHLNQFVDPEAVNDRAFADQAQKIADLGGAQAVLERGQFDYTPATSG